MIDDGELTINLVDKRGITNRDPIAYTISILPDSKPSISIIKPSPITELGDDQIVQIELEVSDDYGFTDLQLAYEVRRPTYLLTDPYVSMFIINSLVEDSLNQKIREPDCFLLACLLLQKNTILPSRSNFFLVLLVFSCVFF